MVQTSLKSFVLLDVCVEMFAKLFMCPETIVAHHKKLNRNDRIKVSKWTHSRRTVCFLTMYSAPDWIQRALGKRVLKVVEQQHLLLIRDETGTIVEMIMTSSPVIEAPLLGAATIGDVVFRVCREPGVDGCVVHISITCSAADIRHRYLLAVRLIIEKIMISDASRVADSYVRFSADVVLGRSDADARWVDPYKGKTREADAKELDAYNLGSFEDSNTTEDSNASVYHDATDELNDDADSGCKPAKKITPGGRSIGLQVRAGEAPAAKAALSSGSDKTEAVFGPLFSGKKLREAGVRELDTCSLGSQGSGASLYLDAAADFMDHDDAHSGYKNDTLDKTPTSEAASQITNSYSKKKAVFGAFLKRKVARKAAGAARQAAQQPRAVTPALSGDVNTPDNTATQGSPAAEASAVGTSTSGAASEQAAAQPKKKSFLVEHKTGQEMTHRKAIEAQQNSMHTVPCKACDSVCAAWHMRCHKDNSLTQHAADYTVAVLRDLPIDTAIHQA